MRATWMLIGVLASGCAGGKPLRELIPAEPHLREVTAGIPGEYRAARDGPTPTSLTWLPVESPDEWRSVGYEDDGGKSFSAVQPRGPVAREGTFEVGAMVVSSPRLPRPSRVSMALHPLEALDQPEIDHGAHLQAIIEDTVHGRLPARIERALRSPPAGVLEVAAAQDGRTWRGTWTIDAATAAWGARWFGHEADYAVSIVIVDEAGGVRRTIAYPGAMHIRKDEPDQAR